MGLLDGKVCLVTGGTRGIGKAICLKFASEGADVAFTGRRESEASRKALDEIAACGHKVKFFAADASDFNAAQTVTEAVIAEFGRLDVLVCNAGITADSLMLMMSEEQFDSVLAVNLKSVFNYMHAATPSMARQRAGSIVCISSVVGESGNAGQCNYSASKAGVIGMAKSLAKELGSRNVRVNCIAPGFIRSDMTDSIPEANRQAILNGIPLKREGSVEDVADAALFFASNLSSYVTGQVLNVCGGLLC